VAVRIGAAQGFSGDDLRGTREIVEDGVDYICCEALAEITLTTMYREQRSDETAGYARDVDAVAELALPAVAGGARMITNAGALNPVGARLAVARTARQLGVEGLRVGLVFGSDLTGRLAELVAAGASLCHADTGTELESLDDIEFAAAYLGAYPIVDALGQGADVVITGRVADTSIFMAPGIHEHGVAPTDWEGLGRLAIMGHLMECSCQVTGGNFSGAWWDVPGLDAIGFPVAEVDDEEFVITKPAGTGGLVSVDTVKEQLLYEVADPTRYLTPDVVADMTSANLTDDGADRVRVRNARGSCATDTYKVIISRPAGWAASVGLTYTYPGAMAKAHCAKEVLDRRLERAGVAPLETCVEYIGAGGIWGEVADDATEVVLRYAVRCATPQDAAAVLIERMRALSIGGPPAPAASAMGTSAPAPVSEIWPALVPKALVDPHVRVVVEDL
jgi:hypothetical protein